LLPAEAEVYYTYVHLNRITFPGQSGRWTVFPGMTCEEISAGLDAVVMQVLEQAGIYEPPVDAFVLARSLRITVAEDERQQGRARYVRLGGRRGRSMRATVLLRPEPRIERRHWALAHEIGEHVAHRVFARLGTDPRETSPMAREAVASQMAGRLLVPTAWFGPDALAAGWDLLALKSRYASASHELIARRMLEVPVPAIITVFDQGQLYFRRSNVPGRVPAPSSAEVRCWQRVHDRGRPERAADGLRTIQAWPVHEEGWKREILRTEVELEPAG